MPPVTSSTSRRRAARRGDGFIDSLAVPDRPALSGTYFLLARRDEIAQLPGHRCLGLAGLVLLRMLHPRTRMLQILTRFVCSTLVPARVVSQCIRTLAKCKPSGDHFNLGDCAAGAAQPPHPACPRRSTDALSDLSPYCITPAHAGHPTARMNAHSYASQPSSLLTAHSSLTDRSRTFHLSLIAAVMAAAYLHFLSKHYFSAAVFCIGACNGDRFSVLVSVTRAASAAMGPL